ncbi:MAG: SPOR domain-containing protein [Alphaproteobacteria bacterium]
MTTRAIPLFTLALAAFVSSCSGSHTAGYGPVRIETYPLDGSCRLTGSGYVMHAKAPADVVVPLYAAPITVICSTKSGYRGTRVLSSNYDPWSSSNVGSLGFGYLVDQSSGSGRRYPELVQVTMIYTEAGKPEDLRNSKTQAPGAEMPEQGPKMAAKKTAMTKEMPKPSGDLPAPPKANTEDASMPAPPAKATTAKKMKKMDDTAKSKDQSLPDKDRKMAALPMPDKMTKAEFVKMVSKKNIRVHLSSFKEGKNANRSWRRLSRTHGDLLKNYSVAIETVDVKKKGTFHRVYAGPLASDKAARNLCSALKRRKVYCRPVAAGAN